MKLREFAVLTDENIHPDVVRDLRQREWNVLDVRESGLIGSSDLVLLRRACEDNRVILTHDSDFGQLAVANLEPVVGIVYLRPGHINPAYTLDTLQTLFDLDVTVPFILVAERTSQQVKIRIRRL